VEHHVSKRAVIYLRVSSASQVNTDVDPEGLSLPAQRKRCEAHAARLGADVVREYVEPGISGGSVLKRVAFQQLLEDLKTKRDVDLVIVWNISRWARNEEDLWVAYGLIQRYGADLVSVTEPIDNSPSGLLMLGVLAAVAAHDRRKLSIEISRGRKQKAEVGGTPGRAPIGYSNVRTIIDGHEVRDVALDPERAPLVQVAFELYATGNYSLMELADILEQRGLRTKPTARYPARPISPNRLHHILRSDYYVGVVRNAGKPYPGRHQPLISEKLFHQVQAMLEARAASGERDRVHAHYLKGSIYCGECGRRLMFSRNQGNGGSYDYFICRSRQLGACSQPHRRVEVVEDKIIEHYATIRLTPERREQLRRDIRERFTALTAFSARELDRARQELARLKDEERKLLRAHYDNHISEELFGEEEARIRSERVAAQSTVNRLSGEYDLALANLDKALSLTEYIQAAYDLAPPHIRRLFNQAFFEKLLVTGEDDITGVLAEPWDKLLGLGLTNALAHTEQTPDRLPAEPERMFAAIGSPDNDRTPDPERTEGSITRRLVELRGLEPLTFRLPAERSPS
jgi:site-specific DNA recombinase